MRNNNSISGILRQKRKPNANGNCRDSARCIVRINGKKQYYFLGRYGSPQAEAEYKRIKAQFDAETVCNRGGGFTSSDLFRQYSVTFFSDKLTRDQRCEMLAIRYAEERFPPFYLSDFTMAFLVAYQSYLVRIAPEVRQAENGYLIKKAWSRTYVNRLVNRFKKILAWGINNGYLSPMFRESIRLFPGITSANPRGLPEAPRRVAVRDCDVIATLPYLHPVIADMVKVQRGACLRPSEICELKVGEIIFTKTGIAVVNKEKHKIARTGVHRQIAFGLAELNILNQYCEGREPDEYVFSMKLIMDLFLKNKRFSRKTKLSPGQRIAEEARKQTRLDRFREFVDPETYGKIIKRAVLQAMKDNPEIEYWTPYQLRHASYSEISARYGYEVASKVAGHLSPNLARVYDHSAAVVSQRIAAERQRGWWEE